MTLPSEPTVFISTPVTAAIIAGFALAAAVEPDAAALDAAAGEDAGAADAGAADAGAGDAPPELHAASATATTASAANGRKPSMKETSDDSGASRRVRRQVRAAT